MEKLKQTFFSESWLSHPIYSVWVKKAKLETEYRCKLCKKENKLGSSGVGALKKHEKSVEHMANVKTLNSCRNFFNPHNSPASDSISSANSSETQSHNNISVSKDQDISMTRPQSTQNQSSILLSYNNKAKREAEIVWTLFCVRHGFSNNSMANFVSTLSRMFPEIDNVKNLSLSKDSIKCYVNYGIYPYFKELLKTEVNDSPFIVACFDESLNQKTQNCELDLHIRYWDVNNKRSQTRFWTSAFMGHSTHKDILENFESCVQGLDITKLTQVSMDGPNVNLKFLNVLQKQRAENQLSQLVDIGTCNLHIVHGAFQAGAVASDWGLKGVLKGVFNLLHDSPARCDDFISVTGGTLFPMNFCETRWVEDKCVAERLSC